MSRRRKLLPARVHDATIVCAICAGEGAVRRDKIEGEPYLCTRCYRDQFVGSLVVDFGTRAVLWFVNGKAKPEDL